MRSIFLLFAIEARFLAEQAAKSGVRLIGIDRPGMGRSTYKAGRSLLDWPDDVSELADSLQPDRFAVVGFSGGGPYALACAYKNPQRLTACGIIAGVGHTGWFLTFLSMWLPWVLLPLTRRFFRDEEQAKASLAHFARRWVEPDRKALSLPGVRETMAASIVEALRQGTKGAAYDGELLGRSWASSSKRLHFPGSTSGTVNLIIRFRWQWPARSHSSWSDVKRPTIRMKGISP